MKRLIFILLSLVLSIGCNVLGTAEAQVTTKNNTPQAPNYDFEVWEDPEPWGWNSSSCFEAGHSPSREVRNQSIWKSTEKRPGSKGSFSAKIQVTQSQWYHYTFPIGKTEYEMMGSLSTGTLYYYDTKTNESSCIYTNTSEGSKRWAFNGRPDSVVVWVKSEANGGKPSDITCYLHNDSKLEDLNPNGTNAGTVIGSANAKVSYNNGQWQRVSIPINYSRSENPNYLLLSFTAGNNFRSVAQNDVLYVDDLMFVYNPTLSIDASVVTDIPRRKGSNFSLDIPFTITGTMSAFNNLPDNEVIAYLSDENGNFDNQIELGRVTTDEKGTVTVSIPDNIPSSKDYKLKLVSTNAPLVSNLVSLDIYYNYRVIVDANKPWAGLINTTDEILREFTPFSAHCSKVFAGNHFRYWEESGDSLTNAMIYPFILDRDYSFTAIFDTNYYDAKINSTIGGTSEIVDNNSDSINIIHNGNITLRATNDFGYNFKEWQANGNTVSTENPYLATITDTITFTAVFDTNQYKISFASIPEELGTTPNSGTYKHFTEATSTATANNYCTFLHWRKTGSSEVYSYEQTISISPVTQGESFEAVFEENLYNVQTIANLPDAGTTHGDSIYSAFKLTDLAQVEAVANYGYHFNHWTYSVDGIADGSENTQNPYKIIENGHLANNYLFTAHFDTNRYTLNATAQNGSVQGAGTYTHASNVCLTASPNEGYHFVDWTNTDGSFVSDQAELCIVLLTDTSLNASFALNKYAVSIAVEGAEFGSVTKPSSLNGTYEHFQILELEAAPTLGSEFRFWIVNKDTLSTQAIWPLTIDGAKEIKAVFSPLRKNLNLSVNNPEYGEVLGSGAYEHASPATAEAKPFKGCHFVQWLSPSGIIIEQNPLEIASLKNDTSFTAFFEINKYNLCLKSNGDGGSVRIDGTDQKCAEFNYKSEVTIFAEPAAMHQFVGWVTPSADTLSKESPLRLSISQDSTLTAVFELQSYIVSGMSYPEEAGTIEGAGKYYHGSKAVLKAHANTGYTFDGWYDNETLITTDSILETPVTASSFYTARYSVLKFSLVLLSTPTNGGAVSGGGVIKYNFNTRVEAVPNDAFSFAGWYNNAGELINSKSVFYPIVLKNDTLVAHFEARKLNVRFLANPILSGEINTQEQAYYYGQSYDATASNAFGYSFSNWTDINGNILSNSKDLNFIPFSDTLLLANFAPLQFELKATIRPSEAGQVTGEGLLDYSSIASLVAQAATHYTFVAWCNENGDTISKSQNIGVKINGDTSLFACFIAESVNITTTCEPSNGGDIALNGNTRYFETLNATAVSAPGYNFIRWGDNKTEASQNIKINGDIDLTAYFEKASYPLDISVVPSAAGNVSGNGNYLYNEKAQLSATANTGYTFYAYTDINGDIISFDPNYAFTVADTAHITAEFIAKMYELRVVSANPEQGQVRGSGLYSHNSNVAIFAWSIAEGYTFSHWSLTDTDTLSKLEELNYVVESNQTLYAHFKVQKFTASVEANIPQAGVVSGYGTKPYLSNMTIKASCNNGFTWVGFTEHDILLTSDSTYSFILTQDREIKAVFEPITWTLSCIDIPQDVKVSGAGNFAHQSSVTVSAKTPITSLFYAWVAENGDTLSYDNPYTFTISSDMVIKPICKANQLLLTTTAAPEDGGTVVGDGEYLYGASVNLVATPNEGYEFVCWQEKGIRIGNTENYTYRLLESASLTAVFKPKGWNIETKVNINAGGIVTGAGFYRNGEEVTLSATALKGYSFMQWSENDSVLSTNNSYSFTADTNRKIVASFAFDIYSITTSCEPVLAATVNGSGFYRIIDTVTLSLKLSSGYAFVAWECDGEILSAEESFKFLPSRNMYITARVQKTDIKVAISGYPTIGGTTEGGGDYVMGSTVKIKATPIKGFYFDQWVDKNMNTISSSAEYTFIADEDVSYIALFGQQNIDSKDGEVIVYPIPFDSELHILGNNLDEIYIFNQIGQLVCRYKINSNSSTILNTQALPAGLYTYKIVRNSGELVKGKAIKN